MEFFVHFKIRFPAMEISLLPQKRETGRGFGT